MCCFNNLTTCSTQPPGTSLLVPCPGQLSNDCVASGGTPVVYVTTGTDATLAATLGIALGGGLGLLVLGALAAYVVSSKAAVRRYAPQRDQDALLAPLLGGKGGGLSTNVTDSPAYQGTSLVPITDNMLVVVRVQDVDQHVLICNALCTSQSACALDSVTLHRRYRSAVRVGP